MKSCSRSIEGFFSNALHSLPRNQWHAKLHSNEQVSIQIIISTSMLNTVHNSSVCRYLKESWYSVACTYATNFSAFENLNQNKKKCGKYILNIIYKMAAILFRLCERLYPHPTQYILSLLITIYMPFPKAKSFWSGFINKFIIHFTCDIMS